MFNPLWENWFTLLSKQRLCSLFLVWSLRISRQLLTIRARGQVSHCQEGGAGFPGLRTPFPGLLFRVSLAPPPDVNLRTTDASHLRAPNPCAFPMKQLLTIQVRGALTAGPGGEMGRMKKRFPESWVQLGCRLTRVSVERSHVIRENDQECQLCGFPGAQGWRIHLQSNAGSVDSTYPWVREIPWRRKWQPTRILAWKIPWTEEPGGLQFMGSQKNQTRLGK